MEWLSIFLKVAHPIIEGILGNSPYQPLIATDISNIKEAECYANIIFRVAKSLGPRSDRMIYCSGLIPERIKDSVNKLFEFLVIHAFVVKDK